MKTNIKMKKYISEDAKILSSAWAVRLFHYNAIKSREA